MAYDPEGTEIESYSCGITTTDAQITGYDFAGIQVVVNALHTGATARCYVKSLSSNSFLNSVTSSNNILNYFAGDHGYTTGAVPEQG